MDNQDESKSIEREGLGTRWDRRRIISLLVVPISVTLGIVIGGGIVSLSHTQANTEVTQVTSRRLSLRPPTGLTGVGANGTISLSWQPATPAPIGYRIYRSTGQHGPYVIIGTVNAFDMSGFTDDRDLTVGNTYAYTVTSYDRMSESAPTAPIIALIGIAPAPSPTVAAPPPLPTFAVPAAPTLTAIARLPKASGKIVPTVTSSPKQGTAVAQLTPAPVSTQRP